MSKPLTAAELAVAKIHSFAQLICRSEKGIVTTPLPVCYHDSQQNFSGHLAFNNPCVPLLKSSKFVSLLFQGEHQYISPRLHSEQNVPTWNFAHMQLDCEVQLIDDNELKCTVLQQLSQTYDPQWDMKADGPQGTQLRHMLKAIVVFNLTPVTVLSRFKLSQNKSLECRQAFAAEMRRNGNDQLAEWQLTPPD